ncbi:MAG: M23 family metallopeptidase [Butyrivibrio sp.]|jgi:murein DD-endopeptidase MepM/ murein hydrolase activator NlpD|nr:M23 family metallopeptidase [Butyrivibrio sp.]
MTKNSGPRKHRHKRNYTIMIISGDSDGQNKRIHLGHVKTQILAFTLFLVLLLVVCYVIYSSIYMKNTDLMTAKQTDQINTLSSEKASLSASNDELEAEVTQLSLALNQKVAKEASEEEQAAQASLPKGFPLSSSASYKSSLDDPNADAAGKSSSSSKTGNPILVFTASAGSQIVAAGDGTVVTVTADPRYGNCITVDHGNGYISIYRNKGDSLVKAKDKVSRGDPLFVVGKSNTTLGYQIEYNDEFIDPESMIEING